MIMRPGQTEPNELELEILSHLMHKDPSIRGPVESLHVLSREFTGVGSYTNFQCPEEAAAGKDRQVTLDGLINMPGVKHGMGALLFLKGDNPECLELYTHGSEGWDGRYEGFSIKSAV